jgi:hypothetical protein
MRAVHPLRAMTVDEGGALARAANASSERVDVVKRARALLAVRAGQSYIQAAREAGYKSGGDSVSQLGEARLAARARQHPQPIESPRIEGLQAMAHGLGMTAELLGDLPRPQPIPAAGDHFGMHDPVGRRVTTMGKLAHMVRFAAVQRWASGEMFGQRTPPQPHSPAHFTP